MPKLALQPDRQPVSGSRPLSAQEFAHVEAVVVRLRGEVLGVLDQLGATNTTAMALSRDLNLNRNIGQRLVAGLDGRLESIEALTKLPGPDGMKLFAHAAIERLGRSPKRSPLLAAVEAYEQMVRELAGSQTRLNKRIELSMRGRTAAASGDNVSTRRKLFEVAAEMIGSAVDTLVSLSAIRPKPESPDFVEGLDVMGLMGLRLFSAPVTLVSTQFGNEERKYEPLMPSDSGFNLIEEFCTQPLPRSQADDGDGTSRTVIELGTDRLAPVDVVTGERWSPELHPTLRPQRAWWNSMGVHRPTQRLVFDVYLHRSLAAASMPSVAAYLWSPSLAGNPAKHWHRRLPGKFTLEMLGTGTANAAIDGLPRHQDLTHRAFELAGWNTDELVGYRCDVPYPTWAAAYFMMFDFSTSGGVYLP